MRPSWEWPWLCSPGTTSGRLGTGARWQWSIRVVAGSKTLAGLAVVVAVAVLREGFEVVLFLYGIVVSSEAGSSVSILAGGIIGMLLAVRVCALTYWAS